MATPEEIIMGIPQVLAPLRQGVSNRLQIARENAARNIMLADEADRRQQRLDDEARQRKYQLEDREYSERREDTRYQRGREDRRDDVADVRKYEDEQRAKIFKEQVANTDVLEDKQVRRELDALRVPYDPAAPMATLRGLLAQEKTKVKLDDAMKVARAEASIRLEGQGFPRAKGESDEAYLGRYGEVKTESEWRAYDAQVEAANIAETEAREVLKQAMSLGQNKNVEQQALIQAAQDTPGITIRPGDTAAEVAKRVADSYTVGVPWGKSREEAEKLSSDFMINYGKAVSEMGVLTREELMERQQNVSAALQEMRKVSALKQELVKRRPVLPRSPNLSLPEDNLPAGAPTGAVATPAKSGIGAPSRASALRVEEYVPQTAAPVPDGSSLMLPEPPQAPAVAPASGSQRPRWVEILADRYKELSNDGRVGGNRLDNIVMAPFYQQVARELNIQPQQIGGSAFDREAWLVAQQMDQQNPNFYIPQIPEQELENMANRAVRYSRHPNAPVYGNWRWNAPPVMRPVPTEYNGNLMLPETPVAVAATNAPAAAVQQANRWLMLPTEY